MPYPSPVSCFLSTPFDPLAEHAGVNRLSLFRDIHPKIVIVVFAIIEVAADFVLEQKLFENVPASPAISARTSCWKLASLGRVKNAAAASATRSTRMTRDLIMKKDTVDRKQETGYSRLTALAASCRLYPVPYPRTSFVTRPVLIHSTT